MIDRVLPRLRAGIDRAGISTALRAARTKAVRKDRELSVPDNYCRRKPAFLTSTEKHRYITVSLGMCGVMNQCYN